VAGRSNYQRLDLGRCASSRAGFQIWPHVAHRQYVAAETILLVVVTDGERQNGHEAGGGAVAGL